MTLLANAQTRNGLLQGEELTAAAEAAAEVARRRHATLIAGDSAGERIIGAAIALHPDGCRPADSTRRLDGQTLLVVLGLIAGPVGLAQTAARLRSLGAREVHAGVLGGWPGSVPGVETIATLGPPGTAASAEA